MAPQATKQRRSVVRNPEPATPQLEVPIRRLAEFVPASFTSASEDDNDVLHDDEARWFKTGETTICLSFTQGLLEFSIPALQALCIRAADMSETDVAEILGLNEIDED